MKERFNIETPIGVLEVETDSECVTSICLSAGDTAIVNPSTPFSIMVWSEINGYFTGRVKEFSFSISMIGTAFQVMVWKELLNIPYGVTATYGDIARRIGKPGASRSVGMACNRNPLLLAVPCHRVVGSGGKMTGFAVGIERKKFLLNLEKQKSRQPFG